MAVSRLRLWDLLNKTRFPQALGFCESDVTRVADGANSCQERLLTCVEAGDTGWWGGYAEIAINVSQSDPRIVLPRGVARLIKLDACDKPIRIQNQFYEYLNFGSGHWPKLSCNNTANVCHMRPFEAFRRNMAATFVDIGRTGKGLQINSDSSDDGKRVLVGCHDANGQIITTTNGRDNLNGILVTLQAPFVVMTLPAGTVPIEISSIDGLQKDITNSPVTFYEIDLTTSITKLISRMEPGEQVAAYSVYFLHALPKNCCNPPQGQPDLVQVLAMAKLDLIPCRAPTDYLLIQHTEALICEAQSMRLGDMDSASGKQQANERHKQAVRYLQGQLVHYEGKEQPAINFAPFGSARLTRQKIGQLT